MNGILFTLIIISMFRKFSKKWSCKDIVMEINKSTHTWLLLINCYICKYCLIVSKGKATT